MSAFMDYIQAASTAKNRPVADWLAAVANDAATKCAFATHISRFTNPGVDVPLYAEPGGITPDGYVYTVNTVCQTDIAVGANFLSSAKLMMLPMEDGRPFIDHLQENDSNIQEDIESLQLDYDEIREKFLRVKKAAPAGKTDERIKQVYFPVEAEKYHLLSVLPSASLLMETKQRIRNMDDQRRNARNPKAAEYGQEYRQIYDLTEESFGGTKPQNVSFLNNQQGGRAFLLPSLPPKVKQQEVVVPKKDFFVNTLRIWDFWSLFQGLQGVFVFGKPNEPSRKKRDEFINAIIDRVSVKVYALRNQTEGWSSEEHCTLPEEQKIWLDDLYAGKRVQTDEWIEPLAARFARWMVLAYERVIKDKYDFGDAEFIDLREYIKEILWKGKVY